MKRPGREQRAVTLLELLVAIAIIATLSTLGFVLQRELSLAGMRARSMGNLRNLAQASLAYAADHGRFVPAADQSNLRRWHGARASYAQPFDPAEGFLSPYLGRDRRVSPCPLLTRMRETSKGPTFEDGSGGYGYNSSYLGGMNDYEADSGGVYLATRLFEVRHPSQTLMFATTAYANGASIQEYPFAEPPFWPGMAYRPSPSTHFRFKGRALVAWCDGHITAEESNERDVGYNPHGGDATKHKLGWFGPDEGNGYWNIR